MRRSDAPIARERFLPLPGFLTRIRGGKCVYEYAFSVYFIIYFVFSSYSMNFNFIVNAKTSEREILIILKQLQLFLQRFKLFRRKEIIDFLFLTLNYNLRSYNLRLRLL